MSATSGMTLHIPAWKKLGLKLKIAKEEVDDSVNHGDDQIRPINGKKRKLADVVSDGSKVQLPSTDRSKGKVKKQKTIGSEDDARSNHDDVSASPNGARPQSPSISSDSPKAKHKSVSFTPETKTQDGEGFKQLYKTWLDKQMALDPSFNPSTASPAFSPGFDPPVKKSKRLKSEKKKKPRLLQTHSSSLPAIDQPALTYLTTYHNSPATWKFSKPHQNYLLKHLFSLNHIPPSLDSALIKYLRGLQGSARSRIREQALAICSEDEEWLSFIPNESERMDQETDEQCIARRKREYDDAVARMKQRLKEQEDEREEKEWELLGDREDWDRHVQKRKRAEVILWSIGEEPERIEQPPAAKKPAIAKYPRQVGQEPVTIQSRGMGGVREISTGGIAKGSAAKKIVFDETAPNCTQNSGTTNATNRIMRQESTKNTKKANSIQKRRSRRPKQRTNVPDDDSSSSESSSSSSSEESEDERRKAPDWKTQREQLYQKWQSKDDDTSSDSNSGSSDEEDSDSE